ncbi:Uncharacterised protein [Campylobacter hyointestinalis subsp. hyointestinalis]|uniref:Uncharacterized protein n=1 Tax=Campylobacter hyointestinalis subsp. hyointestinalis TaxID=91352 RepID=A0A0S4STQ4_CAMHY|nr:ribbon-helix-helix protein, CopG family [Campylobacter hyointestinalis]CUU89780.1 Uncharacterised protein [Campylobacter hyointestinalis subsp. hyointestinalis]
MTNTVKITFSADAKLKQTLDELKKDFGLKSISSIITEAVEEFKHKKEMENWRNAMKKADNDPELVTLLYEDLEIGDLDETR